MSSGSSDEGVWVGMVRDFVSKFGNPVFALKTETGGGSNIFAMPEEFECKPVYPVRVEEAPRYFLVGSVRKTEDAIRMLSSRIVRCSETLRVTDVELLRSRPVWYPLGETQPILEMSDPRWADGVVVALPYNGEHEIQANVGSIIMARAGMSLREYAALCEEAQPTIEGSSLFWDGTAPMVTLGDMIAALGRGRVATRVENPLLVENIMQSQTK